MSILINEAYSNKNSQLWRSIQPATPAPASFQINTIAQDMSVARSITLTGLTVGQRYQFSLNWNLRTATGLGVPAKLADGTNGFAVCCTAPGDASKQPTELHSRTALTDYTPGCIKLSQDWTQAPFGTGSVVNFYLNLQQQITLTVQTTSLTFTIQRNGSPSYTIAGTSIYLDSCTNWYTQPIV